MDLTIILKILKNMHFQNREIKLSRVVWSVSLLRPHSGGHTETAVIKNYFVFQDFQIFRFFIILKFIDKSFKSLANTLTAHGGPDLSTNNENLGYYIRDIFYLLLYFVLTNYEVFPTIIRVRVPISTSAPQNPMSDPLTKELILKP